MDLSGKMISSSSRKTHLLSSFTHLLVHVFLLSLQPIENFSRPFSLRYSIRYEHEPTPKLPVLFITIEFDELVILFGLRISFSG